MEVLLQYFIDHLGGGWTIIIGVILYLFAEFTLDVIRDQVTDDINRKLNQWRKSGRAKRAIRRALKKAKLARRRRGHRKNG